MNDEQPVAKITLNEIYRLTMDVKRIVEGMAEREKAAVRETAAIRDDVADHEGRIRGLEKWKYAIPVSTVLVILEVLRGILQGA